MKHLIDNRFGPLALVLAAMLALYGVAAVTRPAPAAEPAPGPRKVPVAAVTTVCPDPAGAQIGVVTPPGARSSPRARRGSRPRTRSWTP
nr:hypothetical protein GCM10020093_092900 [Planobispora longispora]